MEKRRNLPDTGGTAPDFVYSPTSGHTLRLPRPMGSSERRSFSERANIIVDKKGKIPFVTVYEIGQLPGEIIEVIKGL